MSYFHWVSTRNCLRFHKRHYTLVFPIDHELVSALEKFGLLETYDFSRFSPSALHTFKIKLEDTLELSGAFCAKHLQVTIPKEPSGLIAQIERMIDHWAERKAL